MKTGMLLGVAALSLGLLSLPSDADARHRHRGHRHHGGGIHFGVNLGVAHYYRATPVYGYGYWDDDYGYGDYGYSSYYRAPYRYVDSYYVRTPRVVVHYHGGRRCWRSHGHWRYRR